MPSRPGKKKLLIVEDHPLFRAMLGQLIETEPGWIVCGQADNITEALTLIRKTRPDAAIVDLTLDGSSGLELIKRLKRRHIRLPVLVLTIHAERVYAERVLRAGAQGFISKEQPPLEVLEAIRIVLVGGTYFSEAVHRAILEKKGPINATAPVTGVTRLSQREIEVFRLFANGLNAREIAGRLHLCASAVDSCRAGIKRKLRIKNAADLYQRAAQWMAGRGP